MDNFMSVVTVRLAATSFPSRKNAFPLCPPRRNPFTVATFGEARVRQAMNYSYCIVLKNKRVKIRYACYEGTNENISITNKLVRKHVTADIK